MTQSKSAIVLLSWKEVGIRETVAASKAGLAAIREAADKDYAVRIAQLENLKQQNAATFAAMRQAADAAYDTMVAGGGAAPSGLLAKFGGDSGALIGFQRDLETIQEREAAITEELKRQGRRRARFTRHQ